MFVRGVETNDAIHQYIKDDDDIECGCLSFSLLFHNNPGCLGYCMNSVASCICSANTIIDTFYYDNT